MRLKDKALNLTCKQGSTFTRRLTYKINNVIVNLTGYTARMQVRRTIDSESAIVTLNTQNLGLEINPVAGTTNLIKISMSAAVTASINSSGVYDLEIIDANGFVSKVIRGAFTLIPEVTR